MTTEAMKGTKAPRTTERVLERLVRSMVSVWVFVALVYFVKTSPRMDPSMITLWLVVFGALAVAQIVLSVRNPR